MIFFGITGALIFINWKSSSAEMLSNDHYILQIEPFSEQPQPKTSPVPLQNQEPKTNSPFFIFYNDSSLIDFGIISPTDPVIRTQTISIIPDSLSGYTIQVYENRELKNNESKIPDTNCDTNCTQIKADVWQSVLSYGFGFNCSNIIESDCNSDFSNETMFKPFANDSLREAPQVVMLGTKEANKREANITYKVNIANTQKLTNYTNTITYIAVPNF